MRFPPLESHELFLLDDYDEEHTGAHAQERLAQVFLPPTPHPSPKGVVFKIIKSIPYNFLLQPKKKQERLWLNKLGPYYSVWG